MAFLVDVVDKGMARHIVPDGLSTLEFSILRLFLGREAWTAAELAQTLPASPPQISRVVSKMTSKSLIRRRRLSNDRRVVRLNLTFEGKRLVGEVEQRVRAYKAKLSEGVSEEEMAIFASVASRVMANYLSLHPSPDST